MKQTVILNGRSGYRTVQYRLQNSTSFFLCYWLLKLKWDWKIEKGFVEIYRADYICTCRINRTAICSRSLCLEPSCCWVQVSTQTYEILKRTAVGNTDTSSLSFLYKEFEFAGLAVRQKDWRLEYNLCCGWKCVFGTRNCDHIQPQHWRLHIYNYFLFFGHSWRHWTEYDSAINTTPVDSMLWGNNVGAILLSDVSTPVGRRQGASAEFVHIIIYFSL